VSNDVLNVRILDVNDGNDKQRCIAIDDACCIKAWGCIEVLQALVGRHLALEADDVAGDDG